MRGIYPIYLEPYEREQLLRDFLRDYIFPQQKSRNYSF